jgi:hypothetical protein
MQSPPDAVAVSMAVQHPSTAFTDLVLQRAKVQTTALGLPRAISGNFASVFRLEHDRDGVWAVKCFTKRVEDRERRYREISASLSSAKPWWSVGFEYQQEGVRVNGVLWPIVKMEWLKAEVLSRWVSDNRDDPDALLHVAEQVCRLVEDLEGRGWSHGDLQHGNLLVKPGGDVVAIDYDGMFVPALTGLRSIETGHRNYQHPERAGLPFGAGLDRFSGWVIVLSLAALSAAPDAAALFPDFDEGLLFRESDFRDRDASVALTGLTRVFGRASPLVESSVRLLKSQPAGLPVLSLKGLLTAGVRTSGATSSQGARPQRTGKLPAWMDGGPAAAAAPKAAIPRPSSSVQSPPITHELVWSAPPPKPKALGIAATGAGANSWIPGGAPPAQTPPPLPTWHGRHPRSKGFAAWTLLAAFATASSTTAGLLAPSAAAITAWVLSLPLGWLMSPLRREGRRSRAAARAGRRALKQAQDAFDVSEAALGAHDASTSERYDGMSRQLHQHRTSHEAERHRESLAIEKSLAAVKSQRTAAISRHREATQQLKDAAASQQARANLSNRRIRGSLNLPDECIRNLAAAGVSTAADFQGYRTSGSQYGPGTRAEIRLANGRWTHVPQIGPKRAADLERWRQAQIAQTRTASLTATADTSALDRELAETNRRLDLTVRDLENRAKDLPTLRTNAWRLHEALVNEVRAFVTEAGRQRAVLATQAAETCQTRDAAAASVASDDAAAASLVYPLSNHLRRSLSSLALVGVAIGTAAGLSLSLTGAW